MCIIAILISSPFVNSIMKLYEQTNRVWKGKKIPKFMINIPLEIIDQLNWKGNDELKATVHTEKGKRFLKIELN
jgi:hypothetical protein